MKRAMVTGGAGFVGANLARRLLGDGHQVHVVVRPASDTWRLAKILEDVRVHTADLRDAAEVAALLRAVRPEWVFHLAAHGAYPTQQDVRRILETNVMGTMNLVERALHDGVEALVNAGSSSEYGFKDHAPPETEVPEPNSHYAVAKASATLYCQYAARSRRVPMPTLRLYSVYGPYEEPTRLMPTLVRHGLAGRLPPLADPDVARDYVYVDDVSEAFILAAERPHADFGAIYNVGSGTATRLREVVTLARRVLGIAPEPAWGSMPNRPWDTDVWVADTRKIRAALGWQPRHELEQGFARLVEWVLHGGTPPAPGDG